MTSIWPEAKANPSCFRPIHFDEFSFSSPYGQISRKHNFCRCVCLEHDLGNQPHVSGFAKAWRNFQFLDLPDVSLVAGARRNQPYGFRFCESFALIAIFGLTRCSLRGRYQALMVSDFAKVSHNLQFLDLSGAFFAVQDAANLMIIFRGRRCARA